MLSNWVPVKGTDTEKDETLQKNEVTLQNRGLSENRVCLLLVTILLYMLKIYKICCIFLRLLNELRFREKKMVLTNILLAINNPVHM